MSSKKYNLIAIVGQTGSGKTNLAIEAAKKYNGEIISADSRAVYKYMDIGTAKPNNQELSGVPIWGIDLVEPNERFTVYEFQQYALRKIEEIQSRNKLPIIVGGSGMYIDSVLLQYKFVESQESSSSVDYANMTVEDLHEYCLKNNIELPKNSNNKRHLIGVITKNGKKPSRLTNPSEHTLVIGLDINTLELQSRLEKRANEMLEDGLVKEAEYIAKNYGWDIESMKGNAYSIIKEYIDGRISKIDFITQAVNLDKKLAKKQRTWFKRNNFIHWVSPDTAMSFLSNAIDN